MTATRGVFKLAAFCSARTLLWSRTERALSSLQRLAPLSSFWSDNDPSLVVEGLPPVVWSNPWAESPSSPRCSVLPAALLGFTRVDAGFYKRMRSSILTRKREPRGAYPSSFSAATGWPPGKHSPAPSRETGVQQALAAEGGPRRTRPAPFLFCKANLFFASADAVRA